MESLKCRVCGGPQPEKALLVIGSIGLIQASKSPRVFSVSILEADDFHYVTRRNSGVCGHWCALRLISSKVEEVMDGPKAAEAMKEKVPA